MPLSNYGELLTSVSDWLNRSDIDTVVPDLVALAHAKIDRDQRWNREMYSVQNGSAFDLTAQGAPLPAYVKDVLAIWADGGSDKQPFTIVTPEEWRVRAHDTGDAAGTPQFAMVMPTTSTWLDTEGPHLFLSPVPSFESAYPIDFWYVRALPRLVSASDTNAMLRIHPDAYLFGALSESAPYLKHDERIPIWEQKYQRAIDAANAQAERTQYGASLKHVALPTVFG